MCASERLRDTYTRFMNVLPGSASIPAARAGLPVFARTNVMPRAQCRNVEHTLAAGGGLDGVDQSSQHLGDRHQTKRLRCPAVPRVRYAKHAAGRFAKPYDLSVTAPKFAGDASRANFARTPRV